MFVCFRGVVVVGQAALDVCEDDWDTVGFPIDEEVFCEAAPWTFDVPLYASWTAIAHVRRRENSCWSSFAACAGGGYVYSSKEINRRRLQITEFAERGSLFHTAVAARRLLLRIEGWLHL